MTLLVILKPPATPTPGCSANINLRAERVDYSVLNDTIQKRTGTKEGRVVQLISGSIQMNITGVCIEENGNTALENAEILECAANTWGSATSPSQLSSYPRVNWRLGDQYMLIQKLTFSDEGAMDGNIIDYLLTLYLDTRPS